jgi:hypothetical protein
MFGIGKGYTEVFTKETAVKAMQSLNRETIIWQKEEESKEIPAGTMHQFHCPAKLYQTN